VNTEIETYSTLDDKENCVMFKGKITKTNDILDSNNGLGKRGGTM
jgi:hypothetical protein